MILPLILVLAGNDESRVREEPSVFFRTQPYRANASMGQTGEPASLPLHRFHELETPVRSARHPPRATGTALR